MFSSRSGIGSRSFIPRKGDGQTSRCSATSRSGATFVVISARFAYYDREADVAWLPTGQSCEVVSEEVEWGLIDHDASSDEVVAIEIWEASERLPAEVLASLPDPRGTSGAAG